MGIDYLIIGERIRKQREFLNISKEDIATQLDVSTKFVYDIELGHKGMSLKTLIKLSEILKVSTDYILFGNTPILNINKSNIEYMLASTTPEKLKVAEELLKVYLKS